MPAFYNNVIMSVKDFIAVSGCDISQYAPLPLVSRLYVDMPRLNTISLRLMYCYGLNEYNAFMNDAISTTRNFNEEIAVRLVLSRYITGVDAQGQYAYI